MAVSYNNLWKLLIDKGMNKTELKEASGISFNVMACMGKNETVSLESLEKICMVLNCNIDDIMDITTSEETVVLLSREKVDGYVEIDLEVEKLESTSGGRATYAEIKKYVEEKFGFKVTSLYIGQIKDKLGIDKRKNYNIGSGEGRVPTCPQEKEEAIVEAFKHFKRMVTRGIKRNMASM